MRGVHWLGPTATELQTWIHDHSAWPLSICLFSPAEELVAAGASGSPWAAGCHRDAVRGVRWLGPTARIASFSSDRVQHGQAFRNALVITDVRSRSSLPFRSVQPLSRAGCFGSFMGSPGQVGALLV